MRCFVYTVQALEGPVSNTIFQCLASEQEKKENGNIKIIQAVQIFISFELFVSRRDPVNGVKNMVHFGYSRYIWHV